MNKTTVGVSVPGGQCSVNLPIYHFMKKVGIIWTIYFLTVKLSCFQAYVADNLNAVITPIISRNDFCR